MSAPGKEPLFLERQSYRARRLQDAAQFLPFVGILLFALPLLWAGPGATTARGYLYIFAVWSLLILATAVVSVRLRRHEAARSALPTSD